MNCNSEWLLICSEADYFRLEKDLPLLNSLCVKLHMAVWSRGSKAPKTGFESKIEGAHPIFTEAIGRWGWKKRVPFARSVSFQSISHVLAIQPEWDFPMLRYLREWHPVPVTLISRPSALSVSGWQPQLQLVIPDSGGLSSSLSKLVRIYCGEPVGGFD
jgi:hypothetical protein